jgi:hypothetical protein
MESSRAVRPRSAKRSGGGAVRAGSGSTESAASFRALVVFLATEAPSPILLLVMQLLPFCAAARLACVHARLNDAWKHVRSQGTKWKVFWQMRTLGEVVLCYEELKEFRFQNDNHVTMVPQWLRVKCSTSKAINEFVRCVVRQECWTVLDQAFQTLEASKHSKDVLSRIRLWHLQLSFALGNLRGSPGDVAFSQDDLKFKLWCSVFASPFYTRFIPMSVRDLFIGWKTSSPDLAFQFVLASTMSPLPVVLQLLLTDWYSEILSQRERWNALIKQAAQSPTPAGLMCVLKILKQQPAAIFGDNMKLEICKVCFKNNPANFLFVFNVLPHASVPFREQIMSQLFKDAKYYCSSEDVYCYKYTLFMRTFDIILGNPAIWLPYVVTRFFDPALGLSLAHQRNEAQHRLFLSTIIGHAGLVQHVMEACAPQPWWPEHKQSFVSTVATKASWRGRDKVVQYILAAYAGDVTQEAWQASVRNAALRGHPEPLRQLLEFGAQKTWTPDTHYGVRLVDDVKKTHFARRDECLALLK